MKMYKGPVNDIHTHLCSSEGIENLEKLCACYDRFLMLGAGSCETGKLPDKSEYVMYRGVSNAAQLMTKLRNPGKVYSFASIDFPDHGTYSAEDMLAQVKLYHEMGFDGIKKIEGKPSCRRRTATSLDDPVFEPMLAWLEEHDIPVLSHVNDPHEFWEPEKMLPLWIEQGWGATEENPSFEAVREEVFRVLDRHPKLRVVFAHFFYAHYSLEEADEILDKYPNVCFDLTPGTHYYDMEKNHDAFRDFLIRRADRILFGTDTMEFSDAGFPENNRDILLDDKVHDLYGFTVHGYHLPDDAAEKILCTNFLRFVGENPRKVNREKMQSFLNWSIEHTKDSPVTDLIQKELYGMKVGFAGGNVL